MPDAVAFPLIGLIAASLIALALVWPQGEGAPSPTPFGRPLAPIAQPAPATATAPVKLRTAQPPAGAPSADSNGFVP